MKTILLIAILAFASCKKDTLQPVKTMTSEPADLEGRKGKK